MTSTRRVHSEFDWKRKPHPRLGRTSWGVEVFDFCNQHCAKFNYTISRNFSLVSGTIWQHLTGRGVVVGVAHFQTTFLKLLVPISTHQRQCPAHSAITDSTLVRSTSLCVPYQETRDAPSPLSWSAFKLIYKQRPIPRQPLLYTVCFLCV